VGTTAEIKSLINERTAKEEGYSQIDFHFVSLY
jgi:hypothetical protein